MRRGLRPLRRPGRRSRYAAIARTRDDIAALTQAQSDRQRAALDAAADSLRGLRMVLFAWGNTHIIRAPQAGRVRLAGFWLNQQFISKGSVFAMIEPVNPRVTALAEMPAGSFGQIHLGQSVAISLDADPSSQFGWLRGRVSAMSGIVGNGSFRVELDLPAGTLASNGRHIDLAEEMAGTVKIKVQKK